MIKFTSYFSLLFLFFILTTHLSGQNYEWGHVLQSRIDVHIYSNTVDHEGALYSFGSLNGTATNADMDPGLGTYFVNELDGSNFIQKLDKNGDLVWLGLMGGQSNPSGVQGRLTFFRETAVGPSNNVYFTGTSTLASYDVNPDTGAADTFMLHSADGEGFVAKINDAGDLLWAVNFGTNILTDVNESTLAISSINFDDQENVYISGYFRSDSADFEPGPGKTLLASEGAVNGYLLKLDKNGNFQWALNIGGDGGYDFFEDEIGCLCDVISDIVVDDTGNILLTGSISTADIASKVDMNPGKLPSDTFFVSLNKPDEPALYVLKLDSAAQFKWVKTIGTYTTPSSIFLTKTNNLLIIGNAISSGSSTDFDPDPTRTVYPTISSSFYSFMLQLSDSGNFQSLQELDYRPINIQQDSSGRTYLSGVHQSGTTVDYNPSEGFDALTGLPLTEAINAEKTAIRYYVTSFSATGTFNWVRPLEGVNLENDFQGSVRMSVSEEGALYFTGSAVAKNQSLNSYLDADPFEFDTIRLEVVTTSSNQVGAGAFLFKWGQKDCNASTTTYGEDTLISCMGDVTFGGKIINAPGVYLDTFSNSIGCDSILTLHVIRVNQATTSNLDTTVCESFFVPYTNQSFDASGTYNYTIPNSVGCDSNVTLNLTVLNGTTEDSIEVTACNRYHSPSGNFTFDNTGVYLDTLVNAIGCDSILKIKLTIEKSTVLNTNINACFSYLSPSGKFIWSESGQYIDTLDNPGGCETYINVDLTVTSFDKKLTVEDLNGLKSIQVEEQLATYQWLDCATDLPIEGETSSIYRPSSRGSFAVALAKEGCADTSDCIDPDNPTVGIHDDVQSSNIWLYPNPAEDYVIIRSNDQPIVNIRLLDLSGAVIQSELLLSNDRLSLQNIPTGNYILSIHTKKSVWHSRIIKQ